MAARSARRAAPAGGAGETEAEIKGELVRSLAAVLSTLVAEIAKLTARLEHAVAALPDGRIVMGAFRLASPRPLSARICHQHWTDRCR